MKIEVNAGSETFEGEFEDAVVKGFGNGGHIIVPKIHAHKRVKIMFPIPTKYVWALDNISLLQFAKVCNDKLEKLGGKEEAKRKQAVECVLRNDFGKEEIHNLLGMFGNSQSQIIKKVRSIYLKS